jgi:hypothetical protein
MSEMYLPVEVINLVNLHLKNHPKYEEGMLVEEIKVIHTNAWVAAGLTNYQKSKLTRQEILDVYEEVVSEFQPRLR